MGTLQYSGTSGTTMTLSYTAATGESSATMHMVKYDTGVETTQALSSGSNSVTVVPGAIYLLASSYYDSEGDLLGFGNFLFVRIPSTGEGDDFTVLWQTDYDLDWISTNFNSGETRIRIPINRRGHWLQWEIQGDAQNQRLELRSSGMEIRLNGPSYGARQS